MINQHKAINWTDGVKINKDHFFKSYFNVIETIKSNINITLTQTNYGLLGSQDDIKNLELDTDVLTKERIVLRLRSCHGITANGFYVNHSAKLYGEQFPTATIESASIDKNAIIQFYVIVVVNPYKMIPVGEPDPEVVPLHHPYALPEVELKIIPKSQFNPSYLRTFYLKVANLEWRNGAFVLDSNYIPPTTKILNNAMLYDFFQKLSKILLDLNTYLLVIYRKNRDKIRTNKLVSNTFLLCDSVLQFISNNIFEFEQEGSEKPPIYLVNKASTLSHHIITELAKIDEVEKSELLQYFYEWTDVSPSVFESSLGNLLENNYDHQEIALTLEKVDKVIAILEQLFKKLSELEYIGQRKDNIVVSEDVRKTTLKDRENTWSIID